MVTLNSKQLYAILGSILLLGGFVYLKGERVECPTNGESFIDGGVTYVCVDNLWEYKICDDGMDKTVDGLRYHCEDNKLAERVKTQFYLSEKPIVKKEGVLVLGLPLYEMDYDGFNKIEVVSSNETHVFLNLSSKTRDVKDIPMKSKRGLLNLYQKNHSKLYVLPNGLLDGFGFGFNSTSINLTTPNTENLEDADTRSNDNDAERGSYENMWVNPYSGINFKGMMKWNISSIPADQTIDDAILSLKLRTNYLDSGEWVDMAVYHVYDNFTVDGLRWVEGDSTTWTTADNGELTFAELPSSNYFNSSFSGSYNFTSVADGGDATETFYNLSVATAVSNAYDSGWDNMSLLLAWDSFACGYDGVLFHAKDSSGGAGAYPILYITYSEGATTTTTTTTTTLAAVSAGYIDDRIVFNKNTLGGNALIRWFR